MPKKERSLEEQIAAKDKTIEVLRSKVYQLYNSGTSSMIHRALENARKREEGLREKRAMMEQQNKVLERKVAERTSELQKKTNDLNAMLQNLQQGVLTIIPGNVIHHEYSRFLESIFEETELAGKDCIDLLFKNSNISKNDRSQVSSALINVIGELDIAVEANLAYLIRAYEVKVNGKVKSLELNWNPISSEGVVEKMLLTVRDVTELNQLKLESSRKQEELEIIGQILSARQQSYNSFMENAFDFLAENRKLIDKNEKSMETIMRMFRNMHTIKGNARTFGFTYIVDIAHDVEKRYDAIRLREEIDWDTDTLRRDLDRVQECVERYQKIYDSKIRSREENNKFSLSHPIVQEAKSSVYKVGNKNSVQEFKMALDRVRDMFEVLETEPLGETISGIIGAMPSLASELGKEKPNIKIINDDIRIPVNLSNTLRDVFMHMFRNAIDHGIETASERKEIGKNPEGEIVLKCFYNANTNMINFEFYDDGKGLNLVKLKETGMKKGLFKDAHEPSTEEIAEIVFKPGVSTSTNISRISGRGVGMDAVKGFLEARGGTITFEFLNRGYTLEGFQPFKFNISVPLNDSGKSRRIA